MCEPCKGGVCIDQSDLSAKECGLFPTVYYGFPHKSSDECCPPPPQAQSDVVTFVEKAYCCDEQRPPRESVFPIRLCPVEDACCQRQAPVVQRNTDTPYEVLGAEFWIAAGGADTENRAEIAYVRLPAGVVHPPVVNKSGSIWLGVVTGLLSVTVNEGCYDPPLGPGQSTLIPPGCAYVFGNLQASADTTFFAIGLPAGLLGLYRDVAQYQRIQGGAPQFVDRTVVEGFAKRRHVIPLTGISWIVDGVDIFPVNGVTKFLPFREDNCAATWGLDCFQLLSLLVVNDQLPSSADNNRLFATIRKNDREASVYVPGVDQLRLKATLTIDPCANQYPENLANPTINGKDFEIISAKQAYRVRLDQLANPPNVIIIPIQIPQLCLLPSVAQPAIAS